MTRSSSKTTPDSKLPGPADPGQGVSAAVLAAPPAVRPGDAIAVVASSSPFDATLVWRGLGWLSERYRVHFDRGMFARAGYLAGSDERRRAELAAVLTDPEIRAVLVARGGYGLSRFVHELDWERFRAQPRWIVGFSDVTALHVEAARVGVMSIHASHVGELGRADPVLRREMHAALDAPLAPGRWSNLRTIAPGRAEGPWFGGNLTLLHAAAAAGRLLVPRGAVLLLEDVTERPYRIDRMLTTLEVGGHLDAVAAFVLGEFVGCDPGPDGVRVEAVLAERLARRGVPVVAGAPVGHGRVNRPVTFGAPAWVEATSSGAAVGFGAGSTG